MRWRIYYGDGSTYSDRDGSPFFAPTSDVQVIAQEDAAGPQGRILIYGDPSAGRSDLGTFCWRDDGFGWDVHDTPGFYDYLFNYRGPKAVIFGRTIPTKSFEAILARAVREGLDG